MQLERVFFIFLYCLFSDWVKDDKAVSQYRAFSMRESRYLDKLDVAEHESSSSFFPSPLGRSICTVTQRLYLNRSLAVPEYHIPTARKELLTNLASLAFSGLCLIYRLFFRQAEDQKNVPNVK
jgi:hypothetical protein